VVEGGPGEGKTVLAERAGIDMYNEELYPAGAFKIDLDVQGTL
jgi:hypothetical protein